MDVVVVSNIRYAAVLVRVVIYLDWSGADLKPDPLHLLNIRFETRCATEL